MDNAAILIVVALAQERRALEGLLESALRWRTEEFRAVSGRLAGRAIVLIQAGVGQERSHRALMAAAQWYSVRAALSLGFAGGLVESLGVGALVLPSTVQDDDDPPGHVLHAAPARTAVASALEAAGIAFHGGSLLSVHSPLRTPEAKRAAHQRTGALAVDMEAAGVALAAQQLGIPWLALKAVVDPVDEPLPEFLAEATTEQGELRWRNLLWSAVAGTERRRVLGTLRRAAHQATLRLRRALEVACRPGRLDAPEPVQ
jgi:nucleoside phosphorylase